MCGVDGETRMSGLKPIGLSTGAVGGTGMRPQCTNAFGNRDQSAENLLDVAVFDRAGIEAKMLANDAPYTLKILLRRHRQAFIVNVDLADGFQNVASRRYRFARIPFHITDGACEFFIQRIDVSAANQSLCSADAGVERNGG